MLSDKSILLAFLQILGVAEMEHYYNGVLESTRSEDTLEHRGAFILIYLNHAYANSGNADSMIIGVEPSPHDPDRYVLVNSEGMLVGFTCLPLGSNAPAQDLSKPASYH